MLRVAIVCEYNPFHNGHQKQINFVRKHFAPEEVCVICIMSGSFVQRGDLASAQKYKRAEFAVKCGADAVLELPFPYSLGMAEDFAKSSVSIADRLGNIDYLCFGSESGDVERIVKTAQNLCDKSFVKEVAERTSKDRTQSYASLREQTYSDLFGEELLTRPNDILALEYAKSIYMRNSGIKLLANSRKSDFSATLSRKALAQNDVDGLSEMVPAEVHEYFSNTPHLSLDDLCEYIRTFYMLADPADFEGIYEMNFDLASKICNAASNSKDMSELIDKVSDKRYTRARVRRALIAGVLGVTKESLACEAQYTVLLSCNARGREYLSKYKGNIPVITRVSELTKEEKAGAQYKLSDKAERLYNRILEKKSIKVIKKPYVCE